MDRFVWTGRRRRVLAAVSGGADSVALLSLLRELPDGPSLVAAHFEHGIRGEESLADAAFVRALCAEWGVPLVEGSADVPALAREKGVGLEQAAREARYAFLRRAARENGCEAICLAHHLDDQAETVLMHLFRGSGLRGLRGMTEEEGDLLRPLLRIRKRELTAYLQEKGLSWREDATNLVPDTPRNALRLQVMPQVEAIYPGAVQAISRLSRIAREEDDCLDEQVNALVKRSVRALPIGWRMEPGDAPRAVVRRALRRLTPLESDEAERVMGLLDTGGRLQLSGGRGAEVTGGRLYLFSGKAMKRVEAEISGCVELGPLGRVLVTPWAGGVLRDSPRVQALSARAVQGAVFRTRREGDYIVPLGMRGRQSLSDYLINRHIDRPMRDLIPLLARGSEILWAAGVGLSERAKLCEGEEALRFEYINESV